MDDVWERELLIFYWVTKYFPSFLLFFLFPNDEQIQTVTLSIILAVVSSWTPNVLTKMLDDVAVMFVRTPMNTPKLALIFSYLDDDLYIFTWHHFTICSEISVSDYRVNNGNMIFMVSVPNCLFCWVPAVPYLQSLNSTEVPLGW